MIKCTHRTNLWGWGCAGAAIVVRVGDNVNGSTVVSERGHWLAELTLEQGGPYNITVEQLGPAGQPDKVILDNVMAGQVWMCVGSDNMALPLSSVVTPDIIADDVNMTDIRIAEVKKTWTEEPMVYNY